MTAGTEVRSLQLTAPNEPAVPGVIPDLTRRHVHAQHAGLVPRPENAFLTRVLPLEASSQGHPGSDKVARE